MTEFRGQEIEADTGFRGLGTEVNTAQLQKSSIMRTTKIMRHVLDDIAADQDTDKFKIVETLLLFICYVSDISINVPRNLFVLVYPSMGSENTDLPTLFNE